jgi:hypothetical protein
MQALKFLTILCLMTPWLVVGCASNSPKPGRMTLYGTDAFSIDNRPNHWDLSSALEPLTDGSWGSYSRTSRIGEGKQAKSVSLAECTTRDKQGREIHIYAFRSPEGRDMCFVDYPGGNPLDLVNAIENTLKMSESDYNSYRMAEIAAKPAGKTAVPAPPPMRLLAGPNALKM